MNKGENIANNESSKRRLKTKEIEEKIQEILARREQEPEDYDFAALEDLKYRADKAHLKRKQKIVATSITCGVLALSTAIVVPTSIYIATRPVVLTVDNSNINKSAYQLEVKKGTKIEDLSVVDIEGYDFIGYFKDPNFKYQYSNQDEFKQNTKSWKI